MRWILRSNWKREITKFPSYRKGKLEKGKNEEQEVKATFHLLKKRYES
jgi:hypothetical protein